jgi:hypothetical protein
MADLTVAMLVTHQTVDNVLGVDIIALVYPLAADEVHDLVLTLSRNASIRYVDLELCRGSEQTLMRDIKLQRTPFQPGSVLSFCTTQYRREAARRSMKGVPGVIALESQASLVSPGSSPLPISVHPVRCMLCRT